jgi:hypothetical protein
MAVIRALMAAGGDGGESEGYEGQEGQGCEGQAALNDGESLRHSKGRGSHMEGEG